MVAKKTARKLPEVFLSTTEMSAMVRRMVGRGELRKIGPRLYTPNQVDAPEVIVARNLWQVIGLLFPGAVVSHRTALTQKPTPGGTVFLTGAYDRTVQLPGASVRIIKGPGPLEGDNGYFGALYMASEPRALLECLSLARVRSSEASVVPRAEIETILERRLSFKGEAWINGVRDRARAIAPELGLQEAYEKLDRIIGALLGTRKDRMHAPTAIARAAGTPYDAARLERFVRLADALRLWPSVDRPDRVIRGPAFRNLAFFDAYFSNFIEGTEFEVEEAVDIVFENRIPAARPADAHDVWAPSASCPAATKWARAPPSWPATSRRSVRCWSRGTKRSCRAGRRRSPAASRRWPTARATRSSCTRSCWWGRCRGGWRSCPRSRTRSTRRCT